MEDKIVQYIIVRKDLKMSPGKLSAQVAHAAVKAVMPYIYIKEPAVWEWFFGDHTKIVLGVKNLNEMNKIKQKLRLIGLYIYSIHDNGLTELEPGTLTCIAIKPVKKSRVVEIFKRLRLL